MRTRAAAACLTAALALGLSGPSAWAGGPLSVTAAWARATPPNAQSAAVYVTVVDSGAPDQLIGASTPVASAASVHESHMVGRVMQMRAVIALGVSTGHDLVLSPGGFHIMLTGLTAPLRAGQTFPISLRFRDNGSLAATVRVESIGSTGLSKSSDMSGMDMGGTGRAAASP